MPAAVPLNEELAAQTKLALRRLASAVAVVTCRDGERRHAMTATAVSAMSMDPPQVQGDTVSPPKKFLNSTVHPGPASSDGARAAVDQAYTGATSK
jgi:hypothetical protein